jgi:signal peptidase I
MKPKKVTAQQGQSAAKKSKKSSAREWTESIIVALALAMVIRAFAIQAFKIPTGSMLPTLKVGDLIMVNKLIYGARVPFTEYQRLPAYGQMHRGDVVVFIYPEDSKKAFIKRLVGFPGEKVQIKDGTIFINDAPLMDPLFNRFYYYNRGDLMENGEAIIVPKDAYFVLGDNSASSKDSRYWGFVPESNILGKAILIYWPPQRMRMIQ